MTSRVELGQVARLYYEDELTQGEIADLLGLQRVKVTRMLAEARRTGVVTITINTEQDHTFITEERRLAERFGLVRCWLSATSDTSTRTSSAMARTGGRALTDLLSTATTVVVGLSRAVVAAAREMPVLTTARNPAVIPLGGSWGRSCDGMSPHELATVVAHKAGGTSRSYPAPMLAGSLASARAFLSDPSVSEALDITRRADTLVVGVGETPGGPNSLLASLISDDDVSDLLAKGAVGDVCARYFDAAGTPIPSEVDARVVGIDLDELTTIPRRIGIAYGPRKLRSLRAALEGGILNGLVTDVRTARALLD